MVRHCAVRPGCDVRCQCHLESIRITDDALSQLRDTRTRVPNGRGTLGILDRSFWGSTVGKSTWGVGGWISFLSTCEGPTPRMLIGSQFRIHPLTMSTVSAWFMMKAEGYHNLTICVNVSFQVHDRWNTTHTDLTLSNTISSLTSQTRSFYSSRWIE